MRRPTGRVLAALLTALLAGCGGGESTGTAIPVGTSLTLSLSGLRTLNAVTEGRYEAWILDRAGARTSLGVIEPGQSGVTSLANAVAQPDAFEITYELPGDADGAPSSHRILHGRFGGASAELTIEGAVTEGTLSLHQRPGQFTMFSPSDNAIHGYPSFEESGVWLFNMAPRDLPQNDMWVRLSPLQAGWVYEGWMVRDIDAPDAVWLSYGKFTPDATGAIRSRDDTGWGPFSGVRDFLTAGEEEFPGDDWISNPLGYPVPGNLALPINLREKNAQGVVRWTHLITIEPASDRGEGISKERPFVIRPYRDAFGEGGPGIPRTITFRADGVPRGSVTLR